MIQFFRNMFSSKLGAFLAVLFVGVIGISFALLDINAPGGMFQPSGEAVATVGDEEITDTRIQEMMTRALQNAREENPGIDMAAFIEAGGIDDAIDQAAREVALRSFADEHGLYLSKRLIDSMIAEVQVFQGLTGQFDENVFRQVLAQQNLTEEEVRADMYRQRLAGIILGPVAQAAFIPEAVAQPFAALLLERRSGQIAAIPAAAMPQGNPPTAEELNAYYQENIARYTLPERRAVRYAIFTREQMTVPNPTEEQVREYYEENSERYGGSETRTLRQIILPDEAAAQTFYRAVNGGADFTAEAGERGFSEPATRISGATQESFARQTSTEIAARAFRASEGTLLQPQRSGLGWHVISVADVSNRSATPLASVRPEITAALREELADEALAEFYLAIENGIDDGASFEEVAEAQGLTIESTRPLAPNGLDPQRPTYRPDEDLRPILQAAFTMDEEEDPIVVPIEQDRRYAMVDVIQVARSAAQPLERIRPLVTQQFIVDRANRRAQQIANQIAEQVNDGTSLSEAVAAADVDLPAPQRAQASRQQIAQMGPNVPAPLRLMFRMAEDTAKLVRLPDNQGWFVVVLESIETTGEEVAEELVAQTRQQFGRITSDEYAQQFVNALLADRPLERNEEAIAALADRLTGRAP